MFERLMHAQLNDGSDASAPPPAAPPAAPAAKAEPPAAPASLFDVGKSTPATPPADPAAPPKPGDDKRPEWLQTNFKTAEDQAKAYSELYKKYTAEKPAPVADAKEYQLEIPDTAAAFKKEFKADDPVVDWFRTTAHGLGLSKDQASKLFAGFAERMNDLIPAPMDVKAEMEKLGPNAQAVVSDLVAKAERFKQLGVFNDTDIAEYTLFMGTAEGARTLMKIFRHLGEKTVPANIQPTPSGIPSDEELRQMRFEKIEDGPNKGKTRYDVDPEYRAKIDKTYADKYGSEPSGRSQIRGG